jgi:hypothetical protein
VRAACAEISPVIIAGPSLRRASIAGRSSAKANTGQIRHEKGDGTQTVRHGPVRALILAACAVAIAGCGLSPRAGGSGVSVTVTRNFGAGTLGTATEPRVSASETVIGLLERHFRVSTRRGGRVVQSIGGWSAGSPYYEWSYYVDGVLASRPPQRAVVQEGEEVWWDLHDSAAARSIPAVVGSFPEPFVHGIGGQRYPTVLECASGLQAACNRVADELHRDGVPAADQLLGTGSGADSLTIVIAPLSQVRGTIAGDLLAAGPASSGVYARFSDAGRRLELLNPAGQVARVLGPGAGLIAATEDQFSKPEWLLTGTDRAGVEAAAATLTVTALHDRFALAVAGGQRLSLPVEPSMR